ncbi:hypothetical protein [Methylocella sp.]|uniref:hypothetical protein n=1 Tax=Methylocella sp. TaxID=1978226 RepID=UPI00378505CB
MKAYLKRLASEAAQPVEDMFGRMIKAFALVVMAVGCAVAASAFLTVDLYLYVESVSTPIVAAGSVAAIYLVLALLFFSLAFRKLDTGADAKVEAQATAAAEPARLFDTGPGAEASPGAAAARLFSMGSSSARPTKAQFAANIDAAVAPVADAMREAGMAKEAQAVEAGAQVAKQLSPYALVLFATGAGVVLGRTLTSQRKLF